MRCALLYACLALGCSPDEPVRSYTVPKEAKPKPAPTTPEGEYRILGGAFPTDDPAWFFKVSGATKDLEPFVADFEKVMASVRFPNGAKNSPVWDLPAGWTNGPATVAMATASIAFGPANRPFVASVTPVGGGLEGNLDRWAGQLGFKLGKDDVKKFARPLGSPTPIGWFVDMTGPKNPSGGMTPGRK